MSHLWAFFDWFAGNGRYMTLYHCMAHDTPWIALTLALDFSVAAGYILIARHWWANERLLPDIPAKRALASMRNIFLFCGICGYLFIPIKMVWPAWRLYDMVMVFLVYFTWKYALSTKNLKVVYNELGKTSKLQEDLERTRQEAKKKSYFLNSISHDLRTPLNGLMLQTNLAEIAAKSNDSDLLHTTIQDMKTSALQTCELLDTLLDLARVDWTDEELHEETFGLNDVIRSALNTVNPAATQKGIFVQGNCPEDLFLTCDRVKLQRILVNLIGNAVKFTSVGGARIEVVRAPDGVGVEIHVIDSGVGIAPADQKQLFEEFFQVYNHERDRKKGFGLGLAIARRLARQLGGDVTFDSALGKGSRFTVVLPGIVESERRPESGSVGEPVALSRGG